MVALCMVHTLIHDVWILLKVVYEGEHKQWHPEDHMPLFNEVVFPCVKLRGPAPKMTIVEHSLGRVHLKWWKVGCRDGSSGAQWCEEATNVILSPITRWETK